MFLLPPTAHLEVIGHLMSSQTATTRVGNFGRHSLVFLLDGLWRKILWANVCWPYLDNWIITDVIFHVEGSLFSRIESRYQEI
ncbi:hypothetical protein CIPAW_11G067400 [Carya illinoinensis]|uniref:Uncharacterized protein n=1 Tax=Carya illinoinensis TaxID=32201 RepID=A0A8T1P0J8_CARIL|nr:hypothetical protein CIPAW_11G067400 [Carya illinoinensis]